jgi:hypothetical protein
LIEKTVIDFKSLYFLPFQITHPAPRSLLVLRGLIKLKFFIDVVLPKKRKSTIVAVYPEDEE